MEFAAERDGQQRGFPVTPVNLCERKMVEELLDRYQRRSGSSNQRHPIYFDAAVIEWNSMCDDEMVKPIEERKRMFPKNSYHLKQFYNEAKRKENERETARQLVSVTGADCVQHIVVASHEIQQVCQDFQEKNTRAVIQEPLPQAAPLQRPTTVDRGSGDAIVAPPIELHAARRNPTVMGAIEAQKNLNPPVTAAAPTAAPVGTVPTRKMRCNRCGLPKCGPQHSQRAATNSVAYCEVPEESRFPGWIVPDGYAVNDQRKKANPKTIKRRWKQHRLDNNIDEHPEFKDWENI